MSKLNEVLAGREIERIEIELLENCKFRWKLWSEGQLVFCILGDATPAQINAMINSSSLITKGMLGVFPDEHQFNSPGEAEEARRHYELCRSDRDNHPSDSREKEVNR